MKTYSKSFWCVMGTVVWLSAGAVGWAAPNTMVTLDALSGVYPGQGGGEFTAFTSVDYTGNYDSRATYNYGGNVGFETFCIETGVEFVPGNWGGPTYFYTLGNISQPIPAQGAGSALPLSLGTAWIYYQFATGQLTDFDYNYDSGRMADDNLLQAAIWALQGNQSYGSYPVPTTANNIFFKAALDAAGGLANALSPYSGSTVQILQMWENYDPTTQTYSHPAQNQLVITGNGSPIPVPTVPDGGLTIMLLGAALTGLQFIRRKSR
jgi:hypothetical protein